MEPPVMFFVLSLTTTVSGVVTLYYSWRQSHGWKRLATSGGWVLVCLSAWFWIRFSGAEFGLAYLGIALASTAWVIVAGLGREPRRHSERGAQERSLARMPSRGAMVSTLVRAFVAVPLAGAASLLLSVVVAAALPWLAANRYVFAIAVAPIIWGLLGMWSAMTDAVPRVALTLVAISAVSAALLFLR
jgi:hypothetical protein